MVYFNEYISTYFKNFVVRGLFYQRIIGNKGIYVMEEDWDNLIILDACRYDMFEKINDIKGTSEFRISRGSNTNQFLNENFKNKSFLDTVYVTANPMVNYQVQNSFYKIIPVWKNGWSDDFETVLPETMLKYSLDANMNYPFRRLIIHFMQPHYPFIDFEIRKKIGYHEGIKSRNYFLEEGDTNHTTQVIWNLLKNGNVDKETVWLAYEENLKIVLKYVKKLIFELEGKTIITSDHGNLFGEWLYPFPIKEYGHYKNIFIENLIKVPWFIINKSNRKTISNNHSEELKIKNAIRNIKVKENI
jgi:hypothetical protein